MDQVTQLLIQCKSADAIQDVIDAVRRHHDYSKLHPFDDINCLKIVLNCVDRNAVKHDRRSEGNYKEMVIGLKEVTELISKGTINRRQKSKSLDDFQDVHIQDYLRAVRDVVTKIVAIVNANRTSSDFVCLDYNEMLEIDHLKDKIVILSNEIAETLNIDIRINRCSI